MSKNITFQKIIGLGLNFTYEFEVSYTNHSCFLKAAIMQSQIVKYIWESVQILGEGTQNRKNKRPLEVGFDL